MNRNATGCNKQIMNKKENHSAKSEIEQAFLRLMTQKSYMDITVTDIVQEANVARVSFYRNFASISEVLDSISRRWIMDEMKETPEEIIDYVMPIIKTL